MRPESAIQCVSFSSIFDSEMNVAYMNMHKNIFHVLEIGREIFDNIFTNCY